VPQNLIAYARTRHIGDMFKAFQDLKRKRIDAYKSEDIKHSMSAFDAAGDMEGHPDVVASRLNEISAALRKYQGRDLSDRVEALMYHSLGEEWAATELAQAKAGNKVSQRMSREVADNYFEGDKGVSVLFDPKAPITKEHIQRIAKGFTDATRGTYDERGLPYWAMKGPLSSFTQLARWGLEKSNRSWKNIVKPMADGDIVPLITSLALAIGVTGPAAQELAELWKGVKSSEPGWDELKSAKGETGDYAQKITGLIDAASAFGIVGQLANTAIHAGQGDIPQGQSKSPLTYPLGSAIAIAMKEIAQGSAAVEEGQPLTTVLTEVLDNFAQNTMQSYRGVKGVKDRVTGDNVDKNERRDLRTFKKIDEQTSSLSAINEPLVSNSDITAFKQEKNAIKAKEIFDEQILPRLQEKYGNDPQALAAKLRGLANMPNKSIIDPFNDLGGAVKYNKFLTETQGEDAANKLMEKHLGYSMPKPGESKEIGMSQEMATKEFKKAYIKAKIEEITGEPEPLDEEIPAP